MVTKGVTKSDLKIKKIKKSNLKINLDYSFWGIRY